MKYLIYKTLKRFDQAEFGILSLLNNTTETLQELEEYLFVKSKDNPNPFSKNHRPEDYRQAKNILSRLYQDADGYWRLKPYFTASERINNLDIDSYNEYKYIAYLKLIIGQENLCE